MGLRIYQKKRNFEKTPEPKDKKKKTGGSQNLYVIQKHAASHLHYDFRLEIDGVLKSWAVPKGPSLDPTVKRLAVQVEDHPIKYGSFEGVIPAGQYGGGTVMLWDKGEWETEDPVTKAYQQGNLTFVLHGKKLKGKWKLVKIRNNEKNWLLMKIADKEARSAKNHDILDDKPLSVLSNKSLEKINNESKKDSSKKTNNEKKINKLQSEKIKLQGITNAKIAKIPAKVSPQLATLVEEAPNTAQWIHEVKFDGYRIICIISDGKIKLLTRNNNDWTNKFPTVVAAVKKLKLTEAVLDGEVVALDEHNRSDFQLLQNTLQNSNKVSLYYYVFDLLFYKKYSLMATPLIERKELLRSLIEKSDNKNKLILYSDHIIGHGKDLFKKACKLSLEGMVSKVINSPYAQSRTKTWLKIKCTKRQEFVIAGYTAPKGSRQFFGSLLLAAYTKNGKLKFCGHVGTGFTEQSLQTVARELNKYKTNKMPFTVKPLSNSEVSWVKPKLVVEVEFRGWTKDNILRHPSFKGFRTDKLATEVKLEISKQLTKIYTEKS